MLHMRYGILIYIYIHIYNYIYIYISAVLNVSVAYKIHCKICLSPYAKPADA